MSFMEGRLIALITALISASGIAGVILVAAALNLGGQTGGSFVEAETVREYDLEIVPTDIDYGGGNVWHAWTFKLAGAPTGAVPGPTLYAIVGEKLRVHVTNNLDMIESFDPHLCCYDQTSDGAQTNIISGVDNGAMMPPGGEFTYEYTPTEPGVYPYHSHSADGNLGISEHVAQGLYGAIIVKAPDEAPVRDEVIFMGEIGRYTEGDNVPHYIMNGKGLPGGEQKLLEIYREGGSDAVAATFNKSIPVITAKVGEEIRLHLINIGDELHSFHAHNVNHYSEGALQGRIWPANTVPLVPGTAETLRFIYTNPGLWGFHCHVVPHADHGMIGLFQIEN